MRKIFYITGSRAEYGVMMPVLRAIDEHSDLELSLIVTGMHLMKDFGCSVEQIRKDGFRIVDEVQFRFLSDDGKSMAKSVGDLIVNFADVIGRGNPDIIFVEGDRSEMLAAAMVGAFMNIPVAHSSGGDVSGSIDNSVRHAITRLAHIHFPITKESADRLLKMGEEPWRIHMFGTPGVDFEVENLMKPEKVAKELGFDLKRSILLVVQHPVTTEVEDAGRQMNETLKAIAELKEQTVLIYPNSDAGSQKIVEVIKRCEYLPFIHIFKNIPRDFYLSMMNSASVMVGNSSSALVEAPYFGLPSVNIGTRQMGRERAENVIDVDYDMEEIKNAINRAINDKDFRNIAKSCKKPYMGKKVGQKIAEFLVSIEINKKLLQKGLTY